MPQTLPEFALPAFPHNSVSRQLSASQSYFPRCRFGQRFSFGKCDAVTAPDLGCHQYRKSAKRIGEPRTGAKRSQRHREAAERRKNAAHGASRGSATTKGEPQRGRKTLPHTSANILLHIVFNLGGIIREMRGTALIVNGTADHVHVLLRIRPVHSAAEIARVIKTNSSGWVRAKWSSNFAWQTGYGVFSVSESNVAAVTKYIAGQEEHHKKHPFQEEFLAFLRKNNVVYDEKYL